MGSRTLSPVQTGGRGHEAQGPKRRIPGGAWIVGLVFGVPLAVGLVFGLVAASGDDDDGDAVQSSTTSEVETTTTTVPPSTTTTAPSAPSAIPGLTATSLQQGLTDQGWYCGPTEDQLSPGYVMSQCGLISEGISLTVFATSADQTVFVELMVMFSSQYQWLEYVATLPWDGAEPEAARGWVQQVTSGLAFEPYLNSYGGVQYEMIGQPEFGMQFTLKLGDEPPNA